MRACVASWLVPSLIVFFLVTALSGHAHAQERVWTVDLYGGGTAVSLPGAGRFDLPQPGQEIVLPFPPPLGPTTTRRVPSWFFGDGSVILNDVASGGTLFGANRIVPLDEPLTRGLASAGFGGTLGARVSRRIGARYAFELGIEIGSSGLDLSHAALDAIEASRASFEAVWQAFAANVTSATVPDVTAVVEADAGSSRQVLLTGVINADVLRTARDVFRISFGGGLIEHSGRPPSVAITGRYAFAFVDRIPYDETDAVVIRVEPEDRAFVGVVGAGWRRIMSTRWGLQADVRWYLGADRVATVIDASPENVLQTDPTQTLVLILTSASPTIRLDNGEGPTNGTSLSADPLHGFETFRTTGVRVRTGISAGIFWRF